ncbi:TetR/AcrR family transcriptional regulator [Tabrizicola sp.]|uniref:TetR/AcrR family transcriptional regulator n=1 Tax=Tabrizicola sp. TaxID=2005166 RepID=UPI003F34D835
MTATIEKPPAATGRTSATRDALVIAAIQLFAERGIHGVSLRAVGEATGQKNTAAVHYHFGDRETLLGAALDRVIAAIREPVSEADLQLQGIALGAPRGGMREAVALAFLPLLTMPLRYPDWGPAGARLLSRIVLGEAASLARALEQKTVQDTEELIALFGPYMPEMPLALLRARIDFAVISVICSTTAAAFVEAALPGTEQDPVALIGPLLDFVAAGLSAPIPA